MLIFFSYVLTFMAIIIAIFISLVFKYELERLFQAQKSVLTFHICNFIIIGMVAYAVHAVMAVYIPGRSVNQMIDWIILPFVLVLLYIAMNSAFKKYLLTQQKYHTTENKKVIVVNDKYLQKKKRRKFKKYHSFFEED